MLGLWPSLGGPALALSLLLLPGLALAPYLMTEDARAAPEQLVVAVSASIALLNVAVAPLWLLRMPLAGVTWSLASAHVAIALALLAFGRSAAPPASRHRDTWCACIAAALVLAPIVARYAGGGVDDWWDLAFVRALADRPVIDFAEPMLGTGATHPRFAWNAWLLFQALVLDVTGANPVELQVFVLAPLAAALVVAAVAGLARAMFGGADRVLILAAVLVTPAWLYGTEALPYFTRIHQDKFLAGMVLLPALLAATLDYLAMPSRARLAAVAVHALSICSVHSLVFAIGAVGVAITAVVAERRGVTRKGWYTVRQGGAPAAADLRRLALVGVVIAALPAWQALRLRGWLAGGQVALAVADNPVVRAHLALDRLVAPDSAYMVVSPAALFGPVGALCAVGLLTALRRRRRGDAYLLALSLLPAALIFLPLVAGGVGKLAVPWMLYRVGWLIPQALLIARAFAAVLASERVFVRVVGGGVLALLVVGLSAPVAADRIRRGMREHPFVHELEPRGTTLAAYETLSASTDRRAVLAPPGFSNAVPALAGRSVVAFSERGTLVFAGDERDAYRRMRDRAEFFSCSADAAERERIARRYDVGHAVFRRRYWTAGDDDAWLDRATAEGLLMAGDRSMPVACATTEAALRTALPADWRIVLANADYFVVATSEHTPREQQAPSTERGRGDWRSVFDLSPPDPRTKVAVLASVNAFPGGQASIDPPPAGYGVTDELAWSAGGALWDDGPFEIAIELGRDEACVVSGVELVPYLETSRREVLELRIDGRSWRVQAKDGVPIRLALPPMRRTTVRVEVTSLFGLTFGLADLRLLGDRDDCAAPWSSKARPKVTGLPPSTEALLAVIDEYPRSARLAGSLARRRDAQAAEGDAMAVLRRALLGGAEQAVPWIEYGLLLDEAGNAKEARAAYARGRAADSNSAWAYGCLAWSDLRAGRPLRALWYSWQAYRLDRRYADALTIRALALERIGFTGASAAALEAAITLAPKRDWATLERARQLAAAGSPDAARALLTRYLDASPASAAVAHALRALSRADSGKGA